MATPSKRFRTKLLVAELFFLGSLIFLIPFKYHVSVLVMLVVHLWLCGYFYYNTIEGVAVQDNHITIEIRNADLSIPLNRVTAITPTQSTFCNNGVFGFSAVRGMLVTEAGIRINTDMCCKPFWVSDNLSEATKLWKGEFHPVSALLVTEKYQTPCKITIHSSSTTELTYSTIFARALLSTFVQTL